jgi:hypothetical protein
MSQVGGSCCRASRRPRAPVERADRGVLALDPDAAAEPRPARRRHRRRVLARPQLLDRVVRERVGLLDELEVLAVVLRVERELVHLELAVRGAHERVLAAPLDAGQLQRLRADPAERRLHRLAGGRDREDLAVARADAVGEHAVQLAAVLVAVELVDQAERDDHAVDGVLVAGDDADEAVVARDSGSRGSPSGAARASAARRLREQLAGLGSLRSTNPHACSYMIRAWSFADAAM